MADIIARFKGDTSDLDTKIKKATLTLQQMVEQAHKGDGVFTGLEKKELEFVKSLGSLETGAKSAKGTIAELTKAFTDMSAVYNRLSEEEKKDEGGKALRASLDQLKTRIKEGSKELNKISGEISNNGNLLDQLSGKFGVNIKQLGGWGTAIGAGKMALDVMKDAMWQSESAIDEWGRTMEGAKGAYSVFLDTLNNGNWSDFLDNLANAIDGSRDLYDAMDRLGSIRNNNAAAIAIEEKALADARVKLQELKNKGDKNQIKQVQDEIKSHEQRLANLRKQETDAAKTGGRMQIANELRNSANSTVGGAMNNATANMVAEKILNNGQDAIDAYARSFERLKQMGTKAYTEVDDYGTKHTGTRFDLRNLSATQQKQYAIAKAVVERESGYKEGIATYAQGIQNETNSARERYRYNRQAGVGSGSGGGKGGSTTSKETYAEGELGYIRNQISELQQELQHSTSVAISDAIKDKIAELQGQAYILGGNLKVKIDESDEVGKELRKSIGGEPMDLMATLKADTEGLASVLKQANPDPIYGVAEDYASQKITDKYKPKSSDGRKEPDYGEALNKSVSALNSINSGLRGIGLDLGLGFDQSLAMINSLLSVFNGVQTIMSVIQSLNAINEPAQTGLLGDIAANTLAAAAGSWLPYHSGGLVHAATGIFVPGSPNGGRDTVPAMLSPGELVLNAAQQQNLANILTEGSQQQSPMQPYITSEMIYLGLSNYLMRKGKGEIVTTH